MTWTVQQHKSWLGKAWYSLIINFGGMCEECGSKLGLEFAHRLPTGLSGKGRGKDRRYYDILKHPLNYRLLCSSCHARYDGREKKEK